MSKRFSILGGLRRIFGSSSASLENGINRIFRDIEDIRKKTYFPANRVALDNAKKFLDIMRGRANEYRRGDVDVVLGNTRSLVGKIGETTELPESMGAYISLLINYINSFMAGGAERENAQKTLYSLLQDAEIIRKNETLAQQREALIKERDKLYNARVKLEEEQNKIGELLESPDVIGAEYDKLSNEFDDLEREIERINNKINVINKEIEVVSETLRDNERYAERLRRVNFLKKQLTTRAFKSIEEYEAVVSNGDKLADEYEAVHEAVGSIENKKTGSERSKKENPKRKEIELNRQKNILEKELAEKNRRNPDPKASDDEV